MQTEAHKSTNLGSGLSVSDGNGYSSPQRPNAWLTSDLKWQAEISGVENGSVVRSWVGKTYQTKAEALNAAVAQAEA